MMRPRDFIETKEGLLFAAIGKNEAFLRYFPDKDGDRLRCKTAYQKVASTKFSFDYLEKNYPVYIDEKMGRRIQRCPTDRILRVHRPDERLRELTTSDNKLHEKCNRLSEILREIPQNRKGVTGSILVDLDLPSSDIDFVVYGRDYFNRARDVLKGSREVETLGRMDWKRYFSKRFPARSNLTFEEFIWHEKRKSNTAKIDGTLFNLLLVGGGVEPPEGAPLKKVKIRCRVKDATNAFDVPSVYEVEHRFISRVLSFTHTYAGQAREGEEVLVSGVLEKTVDDEFLVVVGTSREAEGEYIKVVG